MTKAEKKFMEKISEAQEFLMEINGALAELEEEDKINWGHVGTVSELVSQLRDSASFICNKEEV